MGNKKRTALTQFNQENIIKAARKLFEEKGIDATTVDDIAKEADYSKSTLYVYFKSKESILNTILYEQMVLLKELLETCILDFKDFHSCYFSICNSLVHYQKNYPIYYEKMLDEIKIISKDLKQQSILNQIYETGEDINDIVKLLLQKGIESNLIRDDIKLLPTVLFLWSGISETIRFATQKQEYINQRLQMNVPDYMEYSFTLLLKSISR